MGRLNSLTSEAVSEAEQNHKAYRVMFNLLAKKVEVQTTAGQIVHKGIAIPDLVEIRNVIINGKSSFAEGPEKRTVYFLISPEGISQEVALDIVDHKVRGGNPRAGQSRLVS